MTTYLIKLILCSTLFLSAYKLLFENEKMLRFNRVYLLLSIVFSFIVPLLTIQANPQFLPTTETSILNTNILDPVSNTQNLTSEGGNNASPFILLSIYITITTLLLFRFGINVKALFSKALNNPVVPYQNVTLVLISGHFIPHSFLNYIFINDDEYYRGNIEPEVLHHELTHVQQKHSLDVLFIELVQAIVWFNPIFILYRKAIQLNHEFLADSSVIDRYGHTLRYQHLLVDKASGKSSFLFTSSFNHFITKKRLIMMTKVTSLTRALCKQVALVPLSAAAIFLFSIKTTAQDTTNNVKPKQKEVRSTKEGVSQEMLDEYEAIVSKNKLIVYGMPARYSVLSEKDRNRLETIFFAMSKEQQAKQAVSFGPPPPPMPRSKPTEEEYKMIKNPKKYAVWIDDRKIDNARLDKYQPSDFWHFAIIYLAKTNPHYGKGLPLKVYLMTEENYKAHIKMALENKNNIMIIRSTKQAIKNNITGKR